jgi:hypothetical protein
MVLEVPEQSKLPNKLIKKSTNPGIAALQNNQGSDHHSELLRPQNLLLPPEEALRKLNPKNPA